MSKCMLPAAGVPWLEHAVPTGLGSFGVLGDTPPGGDIFDESLAEAFRTELLLPSLPENALPRLEAAALNLAIKPPRLLRRAGIAKVFVVLVIMFCSPCADAAPDVDDNVMGVLSVGTLDTLSPVFIVEFFPATLVHGI